jgi:hypothetical protein
LPPPLAVVPLAREWLLHGVEEGPADVVLLHTVLDADILPDVLPAVLEVVLRLADVLGVSGKHIAAAPPLDELGGVVIWLELSLSSCSSEHIESLAMANEGRRGA